MIIEIGSVRINLDNVISYQSISDGVSSGIRFKTLDKETYNINYKDAQARDNALSQIEIAIIRNQHFVSI